MVEVTAVTAATVAPVAAAAVAVDTAAVVATATLAGTTTQDTETAPTAIIQLVAIPTGMKPFRISSWQLRMHLSYLFFLSNICRSIY